MRREVKEERKNEAKENEATENEEEGKGGRCMLASSPVRSLYRFFTAFDHGAPTEMYVAVVGANRCCCSPKTICFRFRRLLLCFMSCIVICCVVVF